MDKPYILHMLTATKNLSPFDVNMGYDAGWDAIMPYTAVEPAEVESLVQDAIFSRGPKGVRRTGLFIGGRDIHMAMDMLKSARGAMVPPFEISVFADPSGAFTTAAGMVAAVERRLRENRGETLQGQRALVLGGTGPVGAITAVLAAKAGAKVTIVGRAIDRARQVAQMCNHRYGSDATGIEAEADARKSQLLETTHLVFATARAGVQVMEASHVICAAVLKVVADVNAVPPSGVAGLGMQDDGTPLAGSPGDAVGIGALAIGNIKYRTQQALLRRMREADEPVDLHFEQAFELAREYAA
jgi:methylene-tetrahydromethanopterin dehydrogenase